MTAVIELEPLKLNTASSLESNSRQPMIGLLKTANNSQHNNNNFDAHTRRLLYTSHAFAQFAETAWQFCLVIFLSATMNFSSLFLVSSYGVFTGIMTCLFSGPMGRLVVDMPMFHLDRLQTAQILVISQSICVLIASGACYILLLDPVSLSSMSSSKVTHGLAWKVCIILVHIFGSAAKIVDQAFIVSIERDWVVLLCQPQSVQSTEETEQSASLLLSKTNVTMRQIDLVCNVMGPAISGVAIPALVARSGGRYDLICGLAAGINVVALVAELICTRSIYRRVPILSGKPSVSQSPDDDEANINTNYSASFLHNISVYMKQPSALSGLGLALLYMNALTFGNGIMTTYLVSQGMSMHLVGILRGASSLIGLVGTFLYERLVRCYGTYLTGLLSAAFQFCCLLIALSSVWIPSAYSLVFLIAGVCGSRFGLWPVDLSVTQIQQEEIPAHIRGLIGGTQQSLNAVFGVLSFAMGLIYPKPQDFLLFLVAGCISVGGAVVLFSCSIHRRRT